MCQRQHWTGNTRGFAPVYGRVRQLAERAFRGVRCPQTRDDLRAECVALAWEMFVRADACSADLARDAVRRVQAGSTLCGEPAEV